MTTMNRMSTLADLTIGNPKTVLNLTAVPLSGNPASTLDYLLIDTLAARLLSTWTCSCRRTQAV